MYLPTYQRSRGWVLFNMGDDLREDTDTLQIVPRQSHQVTYAYQLYALYGKVAYLSALRVHSPRFGHCKALSLQSLEVLSLNPYTGRIQLGICQSMRVATTQRITHLLRRLSSLFPFHHTSPSARPLDILRPKTSNRCHSVI